MAQKPDIKEIIIKSNSQQTSYSLDLSAIVGKYYSAGNKQYVICVNEEGKLYTVEQGGSTLSTSSSSLPLFYINSFYCGGNEGNEHSLDNLCTHNFVEIANLTSKDVCLDGLSLQYAENGLDWQVLPLKGIIRAGSTFLVRGAQCSVIDYDYSKIIVDDYDMLWLNKQNEPIKFSNKAAKFYLKVGTEKSTYANPWRANGIDGSVEEGYIDLVGVVANGGTQDGYEKNAYTVVSMTNKIFKKYYSMDPVSQANKNAPSDRNNATLLDYVNLERNDGELVPSIEDYTPMASSSGKNLFYNKTTMDYNKPSVITCTFGINATDDGVSGATRCFNWLDRGLHNEYIWIRPKGSDSWGEGYESITDASDVNKRTTVEYSNNVVITAHKYIKRGLTAGTYEYIAGRKDEDGSPLLSACTTPREFTVRLSSAVNSEGFTFIQTTDQQGFNWEEYRVWEASSLYIERDSDTSGAHFSINTGDLTQNGNRISEWLDYFNSLSDRAKNMEDMCTIGNNDLSPTNLYTLGTGAAGTSKISPFNYHLFFAHEYQEGNIPSFNIEGKTCFIPSVYSFNYGDAHFLCLNSEISSDTESGVYNLETSEAIYPKLKEWCETDFAANSGKTWNIAYCHEMPFTILTNANYKTAGETSGYARPGSRINTNTNEQYWFSEFCQTHNISLVLGGHKHTIAVSKPLVENVHYNDGVRTVDSMKPIIVVGDDITLVADDNGGMYPDGETIIRKDYCTFINKSNLPEGTTPVIYSMLQATGYKHTSNKELPAADIPWLDFYYPCTLDNGKDKVNGNQRFPFYGVWTITFGETAKIEGKLKKVDGIFDGSGKFNVNTDLDRVKAGKKTNNGDSNIETVEVKSVSISKN